MAGDLLLTKLFLPKLRPSLTPRPHLIKKLDTGLDGKLTLISAPAGFGKTTLISSWARQNEHPTAWLSLDEGDSDPTRFLIYILAALNRLEGIKAEFGQGSSALLQSPQPTPIPAVLTDLINELSVLPDAITLVLDDYHLIEGKLVHDAVGFLLEHLPPQMHVMIVTRDDPPLPLARLRGRGQLLELRAADLRFTRSEVGEFLNQAMKLELPAAEITALETRTEGWIAGLQLAALALRGQLSMNGDEDVAGLVQSFTGSHRYILDYLIEEVLNQQPESVQTFLLQTAVLKRLSGPLCDALTGQDNGQATLEMLEHANLFIVPLDNERRWYRYHHLFADLLRQQLRQKHADWLPELHRRASDWYDQNGIAAEAVVHALDAGDFARAADLIEIDAENLWQQGNHARLRMWLTKIPTEMISNRPHLCIFYSWYLFAGGQQETAEHILQAAEEIVEKTPAPTHKNTPPRAAESAERNSLKLKGRISTVRAFMASFRGDVPTIIHQAEQALAYLPEDDLTWRSNAAITLGDAYGFQGNMPAAYQARLAAAQACQAAGDLYFVMIANLKLAITLRAQGQLQQTIEVCNQQMQLAIANGISQSPAAGWCLAVWGEVLAELNDLDSALQKVTTGVALTEKGVDLAMIGWSYLCLVRVLFALQEHTKIEAIMQKMAQLDREADVPPWITGQMSLWQTRSWLEQDNLELVNQWITQHGRGLDETKPLPKMDYYLLIENTAMARNLLALGRIAKATKLLQQLFAQAKAGEGTTRMIEILILQALAFQVSGEKETAVAQLEQALILAEPCGFIRTFVNEGPPMAQLLYAALSRGIAPEYVSQLLSAFPVSDPQETKPAPSANAEFAWIEPLSEREIEVLQLIAAGLSNKEISIRLHLSLNTIKTHTRNIYSKLGVNSRLQAVFRAQALEIISSA